MVHVKLEDGHANNGPANAPRIISWIRGAYFPVLELEELAEVEIPKV